LDHCSLRRQLLLSMALQALGFEDAHEGPVLSPLFLRSLNSAERRWQSAAQAAPTVQELAAYGLGSSHRRSFWLHWSQTDEAVAQESFSLCLAHADAATPSSELAESLAQVELDVGRTFAEAQPADADTQSLRRVLRALSACREALGSPHSAYVQGQNFCAAFALLALKNDSERCTEAVAFAVLRELLHVRLAAYFYSTSLAELRQDLDALCEWFSLSQPATHEALQAQGLSLSVLTPRWFLTAFVGAAPAEATLRLWDALLCPALAQPAAARRACRRAAKRLLLAAVSSLGAAHDPQSAAKALRDAAGRLGSCTELCAAALEGCGGASDALDTPPPVRSAVEPESGRKRKARETPGLAARAVGAFLEAAAAAATPGKRGRRERGEVVRSPGAEWHTPLPGRTGGRGGASVELKDFRRRAEEQEE
jgi:hypothetical protein